MEIKRKLKTKNNKKEKMAKAAKNVKLFKKSNRKLICDEKSINGEVCINDKKIFAKPLEKEEKSKKSKQIAIKNLKEKKHIFLVHKVSGAALFNGFIAASCILCLSFSVYFIVKIIGLYV